MKMTIGTRVVIVDTRDGEPVGFPFTGDRLEERHRAGCESPHADVARMNEREGWARFQIVVLPEELTPYQGAGR